MEAMRPSTLKIWRAKNLGKFCPKSQK